MFFLGSGFNIEPKEIRKDMKKKSLLVSLNFLLFLSSCSGEGETPLETSFSLPLSGEKKEAETSLYYSDTYFDKKASSYQPSLATCSLLLSLSAFPKEKEEPKAVSLLESLGFENVKAYGYEEETETDSIAYVLAKKEVKGRTLLGILIRGSGYGSEWGGNVKVGREGKEHLGFQIAADKVKEGIADYLSINNIAGDVLLWGAGYSRAGGVLNLLMADFDQEVNEKKSLFSGRVTATKNDIYAYCFEPPRTVEAGSENELATYRGENYNNIFNIVNAEDIVPKLPMASLGFTRFGIDHILKEEKADPEYEEAGRKLKKSYSELTSSSLHDFTLKGNDSYEGMRKSVSSLRPLSSLSVYEEELLDLFSFAVGSREDYVENLESLESKVLSKLCQEGYVFPLKQCKEIVTSYFKIVEIASLFSSYESGDIDRLVNVLTPLLDSLLNAIGAESDEKEEKSSLKMLLTSLYVMEQADPTLLPTLLNVSSLKSREDLEKVNPDNLIAMIENHFPEVIYLLLKEEDPNYGGKKENKSRYYLVSTSDSFTGEFYWKDGDKKVVFASFENGLPKKVDSSFPYGIYYGERRIYLPEEKNLFFSSKDSPTFEVTFVDESIESKESIKKLPFTLVKED